MTGAVLLVARAALAAPSVPGQEPRASVNNVRFLLWTRSNPGAEEYHQLVTGNLNTLSRSPLNRDDPTVILIHGFAVKGDSGWCIKAKEELLRLGSYNVISVDWAKLAAAPWYPIAVASVPKVGAHAAEFLEWLASAGGLDVSQLVVAGHSLGAHIAGALANNLVSFSLPHITGMDPAGPEFRYKPASGRLDPSDAHFVQVIHTNGGGIMQSCVGLWDPLGHVDVYPNGGEHQPGCAVGGQDWTDLLQGGCSHGRSHDYWVESINGQSAFTAVPCQDWSTFQAGDCNSCGHGCLQMGFHVDQNLRGKYYLRTNTKSPYAQG
ncbi:pancreatic triacylglycerol lipase-like isoform X2 [Panulirus ornatus]|uniref:pancreatic triacylglycerol lipase-like isoform X2 n=1 Tax=Panulirus ornatus TaxID=150431 RepID=UPI003A878068